MREYYHSHGIFLGEDDANRPVTSRKHIPYLEAIIGAKYLLDGMDICRDWVMGTVIP